MRASELAPSPHLEAADLSGDTTYTIARVSKERVGKEGVEKGVLFFAEVQRGLVLNKTNVLRIVAQLGNETDDWQGSKITLYPTETEFNGKTVPCIRVRERI
jgi:hypothetical protein